MHFYGERFIITGQKLNIRYQPNKWSEELILKKYLDIKIQGKASRENSFFRQSENWILLIT